MLRIALPVHLHGDGIHQKGHVIVDDLDNGMTGYPAVLLQLRVIDAEFGRTAAETSRESKMRQGGAVQIGRVHLCQVFPGYLVEVLLNEYGGFLSLGGGQALPCQREGFVNDRTFLFFESVGHGPSLLIVVDGTTF